MAGFQPAECPKDCIYRGMEYSPGKAGCNYLAMTEQLRGCDPGMDCIRYKRRNSVPKQPKPLIIRIPVSPRQNPPRPAETRKVTPHKEPVKRRPIGWDHVRGYQMWQEGASYRQIATEMGISRGTVVERAQRCWKQGRP